MARAASNLRTIARVAAASWLALAPATGCSETVLRGSSAPRPAPPITHVVLIELTDPSAAGELERDCNDLLPRIPDVIFHGCGRPVDIGRGSVDGNYTLGLLVGYQDEAAYRRYLDHPLHQELVEKWRPRWLRVRIFDIGNDALR